MLTYVFTLSADEYVRAHTHGLGHPVSRWPHLVFLGIPVVFIGL